MLVLATLLLSVDGKTLKTPLSQSLSLLCVSSFALYSLPADSFEVKLHHPISLTQGKIYVKSMPFDLICYMAPLMFVLKSAHPILLAARYKGVAVCHKFPDPPRPLTLPSPLLLPS